MEESEERGGTERSERGREQGEKGEKGGEGKQRENVFKQLNNKTLSLNESSLPVFFSPWSAATPGPSCWDRPLEVSEKQACGFLCSVTFPLVPALSACQSVEGFFDNGASSMGASEVREQGKERHWGTRKLGLSCPSGGTGAQLESPFLAHAWSPPCKLTSWQSP